MLISFKNVESEEAVKFQEVFKDKMRKPTFLPANCFLINAHVDEDIIEYAQKHFKSWKYSLEDDNPTALYFSDSFKLSPFAFYQGVDEKDLINSINRIIEDEDYWFCDLDGKPEGKEWKNLIEQFKVKLIENQFTSYEKIENYLTDKCKDIFNDCNADISIEQDSYRK